MLRQLAYQSLAEAVIRFYFLLACAEPEAKRKKTQGSAEEDDAAATGV